MSAPNGSSRNFLNAKWPLVGRSEELGLIATAIHESSVHGGVVIGGAAGVGKSRLAQEALAAAAQSAVRWIVATPAARAITLGAFSEWLPVDGSDPVHLVSHVIAALLDNGAGSRPVVIAVDDAQFLDDTSAFVVHQLVHRRLASVLLTIRTDVPVSDAVAAVWKDSDLRRLELQALGQAECVKLLATALCAPVDPVSAQRLWKLTRGNVLYLRTVVEQERQGRRLRQDGTSWKWEGDLVVSATLQELVERRMGVLPGAVADVVDLLAVAEPLAVAELVDLVDVSAVEYAEQSGLLVVDEGGDSGVVARLAHPLYGESRRAAAGRARLRRLRGMVAARLAANRDSDTTDILRYAVLAVDSDLEPDPDELLRAAEVAVWRSDHYLGLRLSHAAAAAGGGWQADLAYAAQLANLGRGVQAAAVLDGIVRDDLPELARAQIEFVRAWNLFAILGHVSDAEAVLDAAREQFRDRVAVATLDSVRSLIAACRPSPVDAVEIADAVLRCEELPALPAILATMAKALGLGELGRADSLGPLANSAAALCALSPQTAFHRWTFHEFFTWELRLAGYFADSGTAIDAMQSFGGAANSQAMIELLRGCADLAVGRAESASRHIRSALPLLGPEFESLGWKYRNRITLTEACAIAGDHVGAMDVLREADASPHATFAYHEPHRILAQAWIWACEGAVSMAIVHARQAADCAAARDQFAQEVMSLQAATLFGDGTTAARLTELAEFVDGPRVAAAAAHARALAAGDGDGLMAASKLYETMGDVLSAADAAAQASVAYNRRGLHGSALTARSRAATFVNECGTLRTPALAAVIAPPKLTGRQREIIALAANGLTNRQIAQRLHLSIRTVEGHLHRAAGKVGVSDRAELGRLLQEGAG